jgi:hypothetical protein
MAVYIYPSRPSVALLWFFMAYSFTIFVMPYMRVVQLRLHASLLRGLTRLLSFFASHFFAPLLLAVDSTAFLVINMFRLPLNNPSFK